MVDIEKLRGLLARATKGPWEVDSCHDPDAEYGSGPDPDRGFHNYEILGADGLKIMGTEDAAHKEIEADQDEDGYLHAWDRIGEANANLVSALRNEADALLDELERKTKALEEIVSIFDSETITHREGLRLIEAVARTALKGAPQ